VQLAGRRTTKQLGTGTPRRQFYAAHAPDRGQRG
jgi:hypothetical protein